MMNHESSQSSSHESSSAINTAVDSIKNFQRNNFFSLKTKATLLAISIGVIPVATVGLLTYNLLSRSLTREISQQQLEKTQIAGDSLGRFLEDRIREIDALSENAIFTDPKFRDAATLAEKSAVLDNFANQLEYYNSILFFDLQGDLLFQSSIEKPYTKNYGDKKYFQEAIATQTMTINGPGLSPSSGQLRVEFAAPVKDRATGELIGIIRAKIPGQYINSLFEVYQEQSKHWYLVNAEGTIFAGDLEQNLNQSIADRFPKVEPLHQAQESGVLKSQIASSIDSEEENTDNNEEEYTHQKGEKQLVSYTVAEPPGQFPDLHIGTLLTLDEDVALAAIGQLGWIIFLGTATAAIVVAAIAAYIADRATKPIVDAVFSVKKIGQGELDTRLCVKSNDELGELNANINLMTERIQNSLQEQQALAEEQRQEKEQLELAIYTLIDEVSDATEGDLTVRANLNSLELSTVADLFNAIIDNLQEIAIEARESTGQVGSALKQNQKAIQSLAQQAITEAKETGDTLKSVATMAQSIREVANNANQAEQIAEDTYNKVLTSTNNIDSTADSILNLRTTVSDTAKKMERLADSSQKISQAVSLIEEIALKTNVLAINAGAEADRAGEYGQGFSVVAEQVGILAEQSKAAISEIAQVVSEMQMETLEVRQAMESGTVQVVNTTRLVENTKQNLAEVLEKSQTIDQLMRSISQSTVSQAETSQTVTSLMQKIAQLSATTSKSSTEVARSIGETAQVAQKLESTVAQFKVAE